MQNVVLVTVIKAVDVFDVGFEVLELLLDSVIILWLVATLRLEELLVKFILRYKVNFRLF